MKTNDLPDLKELENVHFSNITAAYAGGMSVVEITDALHAIKCKFVHSVLRRFNPIPPANKGGGKNLQDLDFRLQAVLKYREYSFLLWCLGWGLSAAETAIRLQEPPGKTPSPAHEAVRRDFPKVFGEIFDEIQPDKESWRVRTRTPRLSLNVIWDEGRKGYIASVPEVPGVMAKGNDWDDSLAQMKNVLRLQRYIGLLRDVLELRGIQGIPRNSLT